MACFHPLKAERLPNGSIVFYNTSAGSDWTGKGKPLSLPCGQCIGCRISHSREWAMRCVHEASLHDENCFVTLTYNPENLPPDCGLVKQHFKLFMKNLRHYLEAPYTKFKKDTLEPIVYKIGKKKGLPKTFRETVQNIKFYQCGEYGDKNNRPHYHAILFGHNFKDWVYLRDSPSGSPIYTSPVLEKIWGRGFVTVGTVSFESAAYVARYCLKKINGKRADEINPETGLKHYERINSFTGEFHEVWPEYSTMSRGGRSGRGVGYDWIDKYTLDCYPKDFTTVNSIKMPNPRYYDNYLEENNPLMYDDIKQARAMSLALDENTELRLSQREKVKEAQNKQLIRSL